MNTRNEALAPYQLNSATIGTYLVDRGVLVDDDVDVEALPGGVSNDVLLVRSGAIELVVKQALPRLRVAEVWTASRERILTEAAALQVAGAVCPRGVPSVVHVAAEDFLLVMERAPVGFSVWKSDLLAGHIDPGVAGEVGRLIGTWHAATFNDERALDRFKDLNAFIQLRIEPYHRATARRHPDLAERLEKLASSLLANPLCLVHGDLSPKNILSGPGGTWVIDWEVAHFGDPTFDLAFVVCHLRCKAAYDNSNRHRFEACATELLEQYSTVAADVLAEIDESYLVAHVACLLLARMDGKSPVEYLSEEARSDCRKLARDILTRGNGRLADIWRS